MKNIILIGMMGCGKTTVGELLAMRLKRTLVDTDKLIEAREGISVAEIFETQGEGYFRSLEMGVAQALSLRDDLIIACGGGLPLQEGAMAALKQSGVVIWLDRDAGDIFDGEICPAVPWPRRAGRPFWSGRPSAPPSMKSGPTPPSMILPLPSPLPPG